MAETFLGFYQFRLFSGMTQADLYEIAHMTRRLKVKKHESVYQSGNQAAFMYLLMDGRVKVFRTNADGREVILNSLRSGEVFGEECVLGEDSYGSTVEATQDSLIGAITTVDIGHYLSSHTHLALEFARLLTARLRKTQQLVADLVCLNVPGRLARLLLTYYTTPGGPDWLSCCTRFTHQEMANHIGCSRETVSTVIGQFRTNGLVHYLHRTITRVDAEGLSRLLKESSHSPLLASECLAMRRSMRPSTRGLHTGASSRAASRVALAGPACLHGQAAR